MDGVAVAFKALGCDVEYRCNAAGTHEIITLDGVCLVESYGHIDLYGGADWQSTLCLSGDAKAAAQETVAKERAEKLLVGALIPVRYGLYRAGTGKL